MTASPHPQRRVQLHRPHVNVWLVAVVGLAAALVGLGAWVAVDRSTGGGATSDAQPVADAWISAFQAKDLNGMSALFTADAVWVDGATGESFTGGPAAESNGWQDTLAMMSVKRARVLGTGDGVAIVAWTMFGPTPGHSAPIKMPGISVLHVEDGRITRETVFYNTTAAYGSS